jgi:protoporphyrinogen oxidase
MERSCFILGAGLTGLSAGVNRENQIYEAKDIAGGICASYYVNPDGKKYFYREDEESYRFEIGGGHWVWFGKDKEIYSFITSFTNVKSYDRKAAVYFPDSDLYVPYPIQNNLFHVPGDIREKAIEEILNSEDIPVTTLADWLEASFGKTLCELFFFPFHELYTAGLYTEIAPQFKFKTPVNRELILEGARSATPPAGYNTTFIYPEDGLDSLIRNMAEKCHINFNKKVVKVDIENKEVIYEDGRHIKYERLISTLSLDSIIKMTGIEAGTPDPYTSVLVVNIGAKKGGKCPDYHWLYIPKSKANFHRVGFYSNVDNSFLPISSREAEDKVSIYVEKAYKGGQRPTNAEIDKLCKDVVKELQEWSFISETDAVDATWVEVAYAWQYPGSNWKERAMNILEENDIYQVGRYGQWKSQGLVDSMNDGIKIREKLD